MRLLYLNTENKYPQDRHLIDGLRELGHEVIELCEKGPRAVSTIKKRIHQETAPYDAIFVGFTSPLLVLAARMAAPRKRLIFNAVLPQYEANIVSRGEYGPFGLRALKWWLLDLISFHLSSVALLESQAQIDSVSRLFLMPKSRLVRSFSGVDEKEFFFDPTVEKRSEFTVLFRGRFLPESGILTVIEAAKNLEGSGIKFLVIGHGFLYREVNALMEKLALKNLEVISERLPIERLRRQMLECHVSLGQLADHPRLDRTLPCKLFESLALRLPYLTGRNKAVFELLQDGVDCLASEPGDAADLTRKILYLRDNLGARENIAAAGYRLYKDKLTSRALANDVISKLSFTR